MRPDHWHYAARKRQPIPAAPASHTRARGPLPTAEDLDAAREETLRPLRRRGERLLARVADEPLGRDTAEIDAAVEELRWLMAGCPVATGKG